MSWCEENPLGMVGEMGCGHNVDTTLDKSMSVDCKSIWNEDEIPDDDGDYSDVTSTQNTFESENGSK